MTTNTIAAGFILLLCLFGLAIIVVDSWDSADDYAIPPHDEDTGAG